MQGLQLSVKNCYVLILMNNGLGYILAAIYTNSSGHPATQRLPPEINGVAINSFC
jgi:hypothetical protein